MPIILYKNIGETPLQALNRLRLEKPNLTSEKLSYAGRLDPLAEGLLLVLVGDECNESNRKEYLGLDKEYEVEILLGISTDTFDLMGIPKIHHIENYQNPFEAVKNIIPKFIGKEHNLKYPAFSSKTINGRALFDLAKSGEIEPSNLPKITGSITSIEIFGSRVTSFEKIYDYVKTQIGKVSGEFRQKEILDSWGGATSKIYDAFHIINLKIKCESGVYMRSLAESIGERAGFGALAFSIKRTKIGDYSI